jgi:4-amino-4-deoxy-L-arabinose transferase-like glycosyltransferase
MVITERLKKPVLARVLSISRTSALEWLALGAIVTLAAVLRFANLEALGEANHYYTAAVQAMLQSWHNFFFAAAEPGGSVTVDKPPVGLWFQVISAYFFGVNGVGVLLPQIVAGILSVLVVYHLVRKSFGTVAGSLAALALAITPVVVATDRNNTMDSTLILTLLLAAWAFSKATESGKLRYLMLGSILVGIGFNIKMLQAYLPLPAFYALYLLGSHQRLWRKLGNLALATVLLLVVSLSWATIVDLTPADQRPYIGSSGDNSELSLITGYNGAQRLLGMGGRGGLLAGLLGRNQNLGARGAPGQAIARDGGGQPPQGFPAPQRQPGDGGFQAPQGFRSPPGGPGGDGGGGMFNTGQAGTLRLFTAPLSKEASWLLPFGLFSALLLLCRSRWHWPLAPKHQFTVLWGGWLLTSGIFFSVAGFFHEYYLSMIAAPLAALVGAGAIELWHVREKHPWLALGLLLIAAGGTLGLQFSTATAFVNALWWWPVVLGLFVIGATLLIPWPDQLNRLAPAGFACLLAALLITPAIWSGLTVINSSANQSLPSAYDGRSTGPANRGGLQIDQALLSYLQAQTQNTKYLMAVPSAMQGADYVLATGRPVLYLGGFMGQDNVVTSEDLARMVANGELRFIYWNRSGGFGQGGQSDISTWVATACVPVQSFDATTQNAGAPDGIAAGRGTGNMQVSLYDCAQ